MKGRLARLRGLTLSPIWAESESYRQRRRCRTMLAMPFAALGGLTWGALSADSMAAGSTILWGSLGAFAFSLFMYLEQLLMPPLATLANRIRKGSGMLAALFWEAAVAGGLVFLLTRVLGAPFVPAVGTALGVGAFYAIVMEYAICGSAAADFASLLQASGGSRLQPERYSKGQALVKQGRYEEAVAFYEEAISRLPREASGYLHYARSLVTMGEYDQAVDWLRRGLAKATLGDDQEAFLVRQIYEICLTKLEEPVHAVEDLRTFLSRHQEGLHAEWALRQLEDIEADFLPSDEAEPETQSVELPDPGEIERFDDERVEPPEPEEIERLEVRMDGRLEVDETFELGDDFSIGEDLVLEADMAREDLFAGAWSTPDEAPDEPAGDHEPDAGAQDEAEDDLRDS